MKRLSVIFALSGCGLYFADDPPPGTPGGEPWGAPITGGTMIVTRDDTRAVVADPDRDRIVVLDLRTERVAQVFELERRSEPGRVVEDGAGRIHVGLRSSGQLATITGDNLVLQPVCGEPRGVAWEESTDLVHVACATGELVSMPAGGGDAVRVVRLGRDLRDVIVRDTGLTVTTFRTPELIDLDAQGAVVTRQKLQPLGFIGQVTAQPAVAWRTIELPDGRLLMSHQLRMTSRLTTQPGGYGESSVSSAPSCRSAFKIQSSLTVVGTDNTLQPVVPIVHDALPVDIAVNATQTEVAVVTVGRETAKTFAAAKLNNADQGDCTSDSARDVPGPDLQGSPTAVAYRPSGTLLVFYPEASAVQVVGGKTLSLAGEPASDLGRSMFHRQTVVGMACASCHPEGRDDGQVWTFEGLGARRTQNISGGVIARAPFHWGGDQKDLPTLVHNVFEQRMSGESATEDEIMGLAGWLHRIPAPRGVRTDDAAVARGEELFKSSEVGCMSCHNGTQYTNLQLVNVGTGGTMKVPSLIGVGARAPYMHTGCATTLRDRFTSACGGGDYHGHTSQLSDGELSDLIAFLEAL